MNDVHGAAPTTGRMRLSLERNIRAPASARAALRAWSRGLELSPSRLDMLLLLLSEVVTNAVLYSTGQPDEPIHLLASMNGDAVRVAVTGPGEGFTPEPRDPGAGGGYGLYLLEKETSRWGADQVGGTRVWFEL
jgi:anti-sigma regulatory factor (Ser/Thr protein kinase)